MPYMQAEQCYIGKRTVLYRQANKGILASE